MASKRQISVVAVFLGDRAPVAVQSMTPTKTHDVPATTAQIAELASAGCEIVRVAVPKTEDAEALSKIVRFSPVPIIADIHFNASLALKAIEQGVAAVRINPGNIGGPDKVAEVVWPAKAKGIPMRIGANSGSLPNHLEELAQQDQAEALVEAALEEVRLLEALDYFDFKISVKSSHVPTMIRAYRMLADRVPYPLHLGVTEAGTVFSGSIKSSVGIGTLLAEGIGDTIRVSLSADPVEEPKVAYEILKALGLRERRRPGRRLHLRARPRAEEGLERHPRRRALPRDRPVDRRRDVPAEAPEDGEAGRPRDGRGIGHPARVAWRGNCDRPGFHAVPADAARRPGRRRGRQPPAARPRRLH